MSEPDPKPAPQPDPTIQPDPPPQQQSTGGAPVAVQVVFASVLTVVFIVLVWVMLASAKDSNDTWQKKVYIFGSVEAVVFTAFGWVFGREVQRQQVASAQADADSAKTEAKQNAAKVDEERQRTQDAKAQAVQHQADLVELATAAEFATLAPPAGAPAGRRGVAQDVGLGDAPQQAPANPQLEALRALALRLRPPGPPPGT